jgi:hypothetical protein
MDYDDVFVVDSENATIGAGILAERAKQLADSGMGAQEIVDVLNKEKKQICLVAALVLVVLAAIIRKAMQYKKNAATGASAEEAPVVQKELPTAPGSAGRLKLHNVEPKTAAMVMAIVADKMGKPINELRFISIKEVEK